MRGDVKTTMGEKQEKKTMLPRKQNVMHKLRTKIQSPLTSASNRVNNLRNMLTVVKK